MKREIKFRVWNTEAKEWYTPIHNASKGELFELFIGMNGDLFAHVMEGIEHQSIWPENKYVLMQFTGLLDKNGKDVYEGDIVTINYPGVWEVRYVSHGFKLFRNEDGVYCPMKKKCEVIGNVWENPEHPELLK